MAEKVVEKKRKREDSNLDRPPLAEKKEPENLFRPAIDVYKEELDDKRKPMILLSILDADEGNDKVDMLTLAMIPSRITDVTVVATNKPLGYYLKERANGWEILPMPDSSTPDQAAEYVKKTKEKRAEIKMIDTVTNEFAGAVLDYFSKGKISDSLTYKENLLPILEESILLTREMGLANGNDFKIVHVYRIILDY
jgi:hypothetical protein